MSQTPTRRTGQIVVAVIGTVSLVVGYFLGLNSVDLLAPKLAWEINELGRMLIAGFIAIVVTILVCIGVWRKIERELDSF